MTSIQGQSQRRSHDFFFGGPIFRHLRRPTRFGGGGGGSSRNFIFWSRRKPATFRKGGGVVEFFLG